MVKRHVIRCEPGSFSLTGHSATLTVRRHWELLLDAADRFHKEKEYAVAIILAQTACEVVAERAITTAFEKRTLADLGAAVAKFFVTYSLTGGDGKVRKLYEVLTGDTEIAQQKWWSKATDLATNRNRAAHRGTKITKEESAGGIQAAKDLTAHVEKHNQLK